LTTSVPQMYKPEIETLLKDWAISTDPQIHIDAIKELASKGATHIVLHIATPNQQEAIDFFGREVLPNIQTGQLITA
jgi:alkanesulfonate monooxygenase SsuD/methylene tetrahydromethanopterin reductase-like flavin-dependent oxidoreductase (luciferase family)